TCQLELLTEQLEMVNLIFFSPFRAIEGTIVGAIGTLFMLVLGLGFRAEVPELLEGPSVPSDPKAFAGSCFIAALLYFLIFGLCLCQVRLHTLKKTSFRYSSPPAPPQKNSFYFVPGSDGAGESFVLGEIGEDDWGGPVADEGYVPIMRRKGGWKPVYLDRPAGLFGNSRSNAPQSSVRPSIDNSKRSQSQSNVGGNTTLMKPLESRSPNILASQNSNKVNITLDNAAMRRGRLSQPNTEVLFDQTDMFPNNDSGSTMMINNPATNAGLARWGSAEQDKFGTGSRNGSPTMIRSKSTGFAGGKKLQ
ncbi:hypothetical protein HK098_008039, partial [Nowakowskiella sp. JEL0407]